MAIIIGKYEFKGPVTNSKKVAEIPGLYAVLHRDETGLALVQIAESANLRQTVESLKNEESSTAVVFSCADSDRRTVIMNELLEEYEYEDALEPVKLEAINDTKLEAKAS